MDKKEVIPDPSGREIDGIFCAEDLERLHGIADVVCGWILVAEGVPWGDFR